MKVIDVEKIVYVVFALYFAIFLYLKFYIPKIKASKLAKKYDELSSPEKLRELIEAIQTDLDKEKNDAIKCFLYINKLFALLINGDWEEFNKTSANVINNIKRYSITNQLMFFYSSIMVLYFSGDIDKANEMYKKYENVLKYVPKKDYNKLKFMILTTKSLKGYYEGDYSECDKFLMELLNKSSSDFYKAIAYYYLALIRIKYNRSKEEINEYLNQSAQLGKDTFIEHYSKTLLINKGEEHETK